MSPHRWTARSVLLLLALFAGPLEDPLRSCGPCFPNRLLVEGDEEAIKAPVAVFADEISLLLAMNTSEAAAPAPPVWTLREGEAAWRSTLEADMDDLARALAALALSEREETELIAACRAARENLLQYARRAEEWRQRKEIAAAFLRAGEPVPDYYLESWRRDGVSPLAPEPIFAALAIPAEIPAEFALYWQGAEQYHLGRWREARAAWKKLLALPAGERRYRSVWAAYMIGRSLLKEDEGRDPDEAIRFLQEARRLAADGFHDSLALAAASLGWEARALLDKGEPAPAAALYLEQFRRGETAALLSLAAASDGLLREAAKTPGKLSEAAKDADLRRVVTAYLLSRQPLNISGNWQELAERWLDAMEAGERPPLPEADRFAWLSYRAGRTGAAARWAALAPPESVMAGWIRAKLALREGNIDAAAAELSALVARTPPAEKDVFYDGRGNNREFFELMNEPLPDRLRGELGLLRLTKREFAESLDVLLLGHYWTDAAYLAERVLDANELKAYVDAQWPPAPARPDTEEERLRIRIRYLLARRLCREGRYDEAAAYYPAASLPWLRLYARSLAVAQNQAEAIPRRSEACWTAALVARYRGMALMGTETSPDWSMHAGDFEEEDAAEIRRSSRGLTAASAEERERIGRDRQIEEKRFHYRYRAADHAWEAAKRMPDNSPALAERLTVAGRWLSPRDPASAQRFYDALVDRCAETAAGREARRTGRLPSAATLPFDSEAALRTLLPDPAAAPPGGEAEPF